MEIEKTKPTFIISVFKVVNQVVLVFSISNFFINKNSQGRKLSAKKIPSCDNSALELGCLYQETYHENGCSTAYVVPDWNTDE